MNLRKVKYFKWGPNDSRERIVTPIYSFRTVNGKDHLYDFPEGKNIIRPGDIIIQKTGGHYAFNIEFVGETIIGYNSIFIDSPGRRPVMFMFTYKAEYHERELVFFDGKKYGFL